MKLEMDVPRIPWKMILDYVQKALYNDRPITLDLIDEAAEEFERDIALRFNEICQGHRVRTGRKLELADSSWAVIHQIRASIHAAVSRHSRSSSQSSRFCRDKQLVIEFQVANTEAIAELNRLNRALGSSSIYSFKQI